LTPNPIRRVLFTFRKHHVRALLIGGQACIAYGAAEFSRDIDFVVLCNPPNLDRLRRALNEFRAEVYDVPVLDMKFLQRGHACHFRCHHEELEGFRIDVLSVLRGCDDFEQLWRRREVISSPELGTVNLLALPDLVRAKKTQRDKDWLMLRRLVEADYARHGKGRAPASRVEFWLQEARTPELLLALVQRFPARAKRLQSTRPLLRYALERNVVRLRHALAREEARERRSDRAYWQPLREELEQLRRKKTRPQMSLTTASPT